MPNEASFLSSSRIALYGLSPKRKTFADSVRQNLERAGHSVYPINPSSDKLYPDLNSLPEQVEAAYIATGPSNTLDILNKLKDYGIKKIWLQSGSFNDEVLTACRNSDMEVYTGCLMMYIPGAGFIHRLHRFFHELLGRKR